MTTGASHLFASTSPNSTVQASRPPRQPTAHLPSAPSPPAFAPPSHRRSRSIDSTHAYKPSTDGSSLSPHLATVDDSTTSSTASSSLSSRRSSLNHDHAVHSASFDSLPTLRTKSALGGKGSVGLAGVVGVGGTCDEGTREV